jgi:hypothetical protein
MEVVLQWLDELDDLFFAGFSIWGRLRGFCLAIALAAAVALHVLWKLALPSDTVLGLLSVSLAALAAWGVVATLSMLAESRARAVAGA